MLMAAATIIVLLGGTAFGLGLSEILHPNMLTTTAARSTAGIGFLLFIIALLHFRAPHKSFLLSIPLLAYFNVQMYLDCLFYFGEPMWIYQAILAVVSIIALICSYRAYKQSAEELETSPHPEY
jgi:hypothetical protein